MLWKSSLPGKAVILYFCYCIMLNILAICYQRSNLGLSHGQLSNGYLKGLPILLILQRCMSSPFTQVTETLDFDTENPSFPILLLKYPMLHTDEGGEATYAEAKLSMMALQFPQHVSEAFLVSTKMPYNPQTSDMIVLCTMVI